MTHFFMGLTALIIGVCGIVFWWGAFGEFLRGCVPMLLVLVGLAAIGAGIKNRSSATEFEDPEKQDDVIAPDQVG